MKKSITLFILMIMLIACQDENSTIVHSSVHPHVKVNAIVAKNMKAASIRHYAGSITEKSSTTVSFASPGTVQSSRITEGKKVNKGTLVASLDETSAKNALEIAIALKKQAEDAHSRMEKLFQNKSISEIQWMEVESKYKQAVASEKLAQKNLNDCKLYAPATGIVSAKTLEVGQNVYPGVPIFKIIDISKVKVRASVPEKEISSIHIGDKVTIRVGALDNQSFNGKITNKGISANTLSRSYEIEAEIINRHGDLLPGMLAEMILEKTDSLSGTSLPTSAVLLDEKK